MPLSLLTYNPNSKFLFDGISQHKPCRFFFASKTTKTFPEGSEPSSLVDLCLRLKNNAVSTLKLCFDESNSFLNHKRHAQQLEKALRYNTSVRHVSIGWNYHSRDALLTILRALGRYTRLTSLQLILDDYIPENLLRSLLQQQSSTLQTVDIQCVQVIHRTALGRLCCDEVASEEANAAALSQRSTTSTSSSTSTSSGGGGGHHHHGTTHKRNLRFRKRISYNRLNVNCDHCVVSRVLVHMLHNSLSRLQVLHLQDCGLQDKHAVMLADLLHVGGGLDELIVRSNRSLRAHGVAVLCQAPVKHKLDLSLCDMTPDTAQALAPAIAARSWPLGELLVCGNYRMGTAALVALVQPAVCQKLRSLNISYCEITDNRATALLEALQQLPHHQEYDVAAQNNAKCMQLHTIAMHGALVANPQTCDALGTLLQCNLPSLRVLHLNDPKQPKCLGIPQVQVLADSMRTNFELEELYFDSFPNNTTEMEHVRAEIDFYLHLNRIGRRILLQRGGSGSGNDGKQKNADVTPGCTVDDWFNVMSRATMEGDLDIVYWLVRHSGNQFGQWS